MPGLTNPLAVAIVSRRTYLCALRQMFAALGTVAVEFLALLLVAGTLIWGMALARAGGLLAMGVVTLFAGIVVGPAFFSLPGGPVPITVDRVLLAGLAAMYVVYRRLGWTERRPMTAADAVALALIAVLAANVFLHDWRINRMQSVSYLLFFWLMPLALYWVVRHASFSDRGLRNTCLAFAALGVYLAFTAVCEARYQWRFVFPRYIVSPRFVEFLGRGRGPLLNPPGNGILMACCLACGLMAWPKCDWRGKLLLAGGFAPLLLAGMYCTLTRSVWMGAAATMLVVVGLSMPKQWRVPAVTVAVLAALLTVAVSWEHLLAFKRDKNLSAAETADSTTLRPILAYVAWQMFEDRPIMGCGLGHYLEYHNPYLHDRSTELVLSKVRPYVQHNAVLSLLVETGLAGLTTFLLMLFLWARNAWQLWRNAELPLWQRQAGLIFLSLLAAYIPNAMFHDTTIIAMQNMLLFFWGATAMNVATLPGNSTPHRATSRQSASPPRDALCVSNSS
jgi:O-antigen ligase